MEKTKKNGFLKTAACIFGGTMLMTCVLGGTLAKYVSENAGAEAKVTAAKWDIDVGDGDDSLDSFEFKLDGMTIKSTEAQYQGSTENVPAPAPGTWGYKEIKVSNKGQVDADITVSSVPGSNTNTKIKVAILDSIPQDANTIETAAGQGNEKTVKDVQAGSGVQSFFVAYSWPWADSDELDTNLGTGTDNGGNIEFGTVKLKAEQANATD